MNMRILMSVLGMFCFVSQNECVKNKMALPFLLNKKRVKIINPIPVYPYRSTVHMVSEQTPAPTPTSAALQNPHHLTIQVPVRMETPIMTSESVASLVTIAPRGTNNVQPLTSQLRWLHRTRKKAI